MRIFIELFTILLASAVVGLWSYAWLLWFFKGTVRQWCVMLMPDVWKAGRTNEAIGSMTGSTFTSFMMLDFVGPEWIGKLLTCRYCLSAHIAWPAAILLLSFHLPLTSAILAWAGGAGLANYFYKD